MFETEKDALWYPSEFTCLLEILDGEVGEKWSEAVKVRYLTFVSVGKSHVLYMLTILYFGLGTKTTSITWKCIYESWVLIWSKRMWLQGY